MSSTSHLRPATEFQIESARIELDADAEALRAALAAITAAEAHAAALPLGAYRRATAAAGDSAEALLVLAADEIRAALGLLGRTENSDLAREIEDRRDAARAQAAEGVS